MAIRELQSQSHRFFVIFRGLRPSDKQEINLWINGLEFLQKDEPSWPVHLKGVNVLPDKDLEWKHKVEIYETQVRKDHPLDSFIQYYSSWYRLLKRIAWLLRFLCFIQNACGAKDSQEADPSSDGSQRRVIGAGKQPLTVEELQTAKIRLIRYIRPVEFPDEVARLKSNPKGAHRTGPVVKKTSRLSALAPFVGEHGMVRVGGRLNRAKISFDASIQL